MLRSVFCDSKWEMWVKTPIGSAIPRASGKLGSPRIQSAVSIRSAQEDAARRGDLLGEYSLPLRTLSMGGKKLEGKSECALRIGE
jgi:hypothetical protein